MWGNAEHAETAESGARWGLEGAAVIVRARMAQRERLHGSLSTVEYFTLGFGTMIGVGWLVLMDDWLSRGGPGGAMLGYLLGGLLLVPIAHTYGRLVQRIRDAGAEIAYTETVFPPALSFAAGWTMVLRLPCRRSRAINTSVSGARAGSLSGARR